MEDVWVVTAWQTVQWMRAPASTDTVHQFKPFQCDYKVTPADGENICPMVKIYLSKDRPPRCDKPKVCNLWHKSGVRYMRTCQQCPSIYPWTGRTGVANSLVDRL